MCVFVQLACVPVFNLDEAQDAMSFRINYEIDSSQWGGLRGKAYGTSTEVSFSHIV